MELIKFSRNSATELAFHKELKKRVGNYFRDNSISVKAGTEMVFKSIVFLSLYILPFIYILFFSVAWYMDLFLVVVMGIGIAGVGMNIMHDACHYAYSNKKWVNELLAGSLYLLGSNVVNWKIQHNILHHTFTNIHSMDEDIDEKGPIRLSFGSPLRKFHRFQHFYAYFFYGFMTIFMIGNDFQRLYKYYKAGFLKSHQISVHSEMSKMLIRKLLYIFVIMAIPYWLTEYSLWQIFLGFFIMHWTASIILSLIFQMAHVVEGVEQHALKENFEHHWSVHQLKTTSDFAKNNKVLGWCIGGLNYQIEHHLFPNICHTHYKHIAPIVEDTANKFGYKYHVQKSFNSALFSHARKLRVLGSQDK